MIRSLVTSLSIAGLLTACGAPPAALDGGSGGSGGADGGLIASAGLGVALTATWYGDFAADGGSGVTFAGTVNLVDLATGSALVPATGTFGNGAHQLTLTPVSGATAPLSCGPNPLTYSGQLRVDLSGTLPSSSATVSASGTFDDPMPWFPVAMPASSTVGAAVTLTWPQVQGASCHVEVLTGTYSSADFADTGTHTIADSNFSTIATHTIQLTCARTVSFEAGVRTVTSIVKRSATIAIQ